VSGSIVQHESSMASEVNAGDDAESRSLYLTTRSEAGSACVFGIGFVKLIARTLPGREFHRHR
jgi:hypothetical protein